MKNRFIISLVQKIFGGALIFSSLNRIFGWIAIPKHEGFAQQFMETLEGSQYLIPLIIAIQLASGIAFVFNRYAALAALALLPVSLNIFLFHLLHERSALIPTLPIFGINLGIIIAHFSSYKSLLKEKGTNHA